MNRDPVNLELARLQKFPAMPERKLRNVQLTDDQYDDFVRISGRVAKMRLDAFVRSPQWQTWPDHSKRDLITQIIKDSREIATGALFKKYPQIPTDAHNLKVNKNK